MVGKNPLWVAKQHGHSVQTMLDTYAAWTEGAQESNVEAIRRAMTRAPDCMPQRLPAVVNSDAASVSLEQPKVPSRPPEIGSSLAVDHPHKSVSLCTKNRNVGERGIRTALYLSDSER